MNCYVNSYLVYYWVILLVICLGGELSKYDLDTITTIIPW